VQDDLDLTPFPFTTDRIPDSLYTFVQHFPFYSYSPLYWNLHYPLQLLAAVGISFGAKGVSRFACLIFAILQLTNVLKSFCDYNNHEYLYSLISLFFACLEVHPILNFNPRYSSFGFLLITLGTGYMMLWNVVYGIAGSIAVIGMFCVFCGVALLLDTNDLNKFPMIPVWNFWFLQIFLGSVYFYAGIAKCDEDWLSGFTLRELYQTWTGPTALQLLLDNLIEREWPIIWIAYSGLLFDLLVPFGLVAPFSSLRTIFALMATGFHLMNHFTFVIETFPWVMIASLVIYFDSDWIPSLSQSLQSLFQFFSSRFPKLPSVNYSQWISFILLSLILTSTLLIPLPCALQTILPLFPLPLGLASSQSNSNSNINYSSQCQFFSWRMMTRTSKLFTSILYLTNEQTKQVDAITFSQFRLSEDDISSISLHEDYLFRAVQQIKALALPSSGNFIPPLVTADIWLQINGPPIQRYVIPSLDLSQGPTASLSPPLESSSVVWNYLLSWSRSCLGLSSRLPSYPWVENRIQEYRTSFWKEIFRNISRSEAASRRTEGKGSSSSSSRVMFFADRSGPERVLTLFAQEMSLLAVMSGQLSVQGYGLVSAEQCLLVQGYLHISVAVSTPSSRKTASETVSSSNSLWMIQDTNHSVVVLPKYSTKKYPPLFVHQSQRCPLHSLSALVSSFPSRSEGIRSQTKQKMNQRTAGRHDHGAETRQQEL
jgi:hypothetical protein